MTSKRASLYKEYPLNTIHGVHAFLSNRHHISSSARNGDYDAIVMNIDFDIALARTEMTPRQHRALRLVYHHGLTQREAGEQMNISQQAVQQMLNNVLQRIAEQYKTVTKGAPKT